MIQLSAADWCFTARGGAPGIIIARAGDRDRRGEMVDPARWAAGACGGLDAAQYLRAGDDTRFESAAHHAELLPALHAAIEIAQTK